MTKTKGQRQPVSGGEVVPPSSRPRKHGQGSGRKKRIPLRTCITCRQTRNKRDMVRLVRTPASGIQVDLTGKVAGRGAYLCRDRACWDQGLRSEKLTQALRTTLTSEEIAALQMFAATLPGGATEGTGLSQRPASSVGGDIQC